MKKRLLPGVIVTTALTYLATTPHRAPPALSRALQEDDARRRQARQDKTDSLPAEAEQAARLALRNKGQRRARALVRRQRSRQVHQTAVN